MRAPAQHRRPGHTPATTWAHPYTGLAGLAVFYNDGGDPVAPSPADLAQRRPAAEPSPQFTQEDLDRIAAREKSQGERAGARKALEDFAKEHGFSNVDDAKAFIAAARQAEEAKKTEEQKAREALEQERQTLEQEKLAIAAQKRSVLREQALTRLGALDLTDENGNVTPNLQDALAMLERDLRDEPDADPQKVADAAAKLKARRPELFGAKPAQQPNTLPPAPGGAPASGTPNRGPGEKIGNRGLEMARLRGHVKDKNAA